MKVCSGDVWSVLMQEVLLRKALPRSASEAAGWLAPYQETPSLIEQYHQGRLPGVTEAPTPGAVIQPTIGPPLQAIQTDGGNVLLVPVAPQGPLTPEELQAGMVPPEQQAAGSGG